MFSAPILSLPASSTSRAMPPGLPAAARRAPRSRRTSPPADRSLPGAAPESPPSSPWKKTAAAVPHTTRGAPPNDGGKTSSAAHSPRRVRGSVARAPRVPANSQRFRALSSLAAPAGAARPSGPGAGSVRGAPDVMERKNTERRLSVDPAEDLRRRCTLGRLRVGDAGRSLPLPVALGTWCCGAGCCPFSPR